MDKRVFVLAGLIAALLCVPALASTQQQTSVTTNVQNVAPHIYNGTFKTQIKTIQGSVVYESIGNYITPNLLRTNAIIPYAFYGEGISFSVKVSDQNGEGDLDNGDVKIVLDPDYPHVNDGDEIVLQAGYNPATVGDSDQYNLTFQKDWTVGNQHGLYYVYVMATDEHGLAADDNAVCVGRIFLNPAVGIDVNVTSLTFGNVVPGETNVLANESPIVVNNTDPDHVGMMLAIGISTTDLTNQDGGGQIPASNMWANIVSVNNMTTNYNVTMSNSAQVILTYPGIYPGQNNALMFNMYMNVPTPLVSGTYTGSATIYAIGI